MLSAVTFKTACSISFFSPPSRRVPLHASCNLGANCTETVLAGPGRLCALKSTTKSSAIHAVTDVISISCPDTLLISCLLRFVQLPSAGSGGKTFTKPLMARALGSNFQNLWPIWKFGRVCQHADAGRIVTVVFRRVPEVGTE